jgi:hypothetical protein
VWPRPVDRPRSGPGSVLVERDIADPVQTVLDTPLTPGQIQQAGRTRFLRHSADQPVDGIAGAGGPSNSKISRTMHHAWAACGNPTCSGEVSMNSMDRCSTRPYPRSVWLAAWLGGKGPARTSPGLRPMSWAGCLYREDIIRFLLLDQEGGVITLGVQRVSGHDRPFEVEVGQQRTELVGLVVDLALGDDALVVDHCSEQVHRPSMNKPARTPAKATRHPHQYLLDRFRLRAC